jgi:hypothetical protein
MYRGWIRRSTDSQRTASNDARWTETRDGTVLAHRADIESACGVFAADCWQHSGRVVTDNLQRRPTPCDFGGCPLATGNFTVQATDAESAAWHDAGDFETRASAEQHANHLLRAGGAMSVRVITAVYYSCWTSGGAIFEESEPGVQPSDDPTT